MNIRKLLATTLAAGLAWMVLPVQADDAAARAIYDGGCVACHGTGVLGAPKLGDAAAWAGRGNLASMVATSRSGKGAMPPRGGMPTLTDAQLQTVVAWMLAQSAGKPAAAAAAPKPAAAAPAQAAAPAPAADHAAAKAIYDGGCVACHGTGVLGAPKLGDAAAWAGRGNLASMVATSRSGKGAMPPRGGMPTLTDAQLQTVVAWMLAQSAGKPAAAAAAPTPAARPAAPAAAPAQAAAPAPAPAADHAAAKAIYDSGCVACHGTGVLGAPKPGDAAAWAGRGNLASLVASSRAGKGAMPPRGGVATLSDAQLQAVVAWMLAQSGDKAAAAAPRPAAPAPAPAPAQAARPAAATSPAAPAAAPQAAAAPAPAAAPSRPAVAAAAPAAAPASNVNAFNRLLRPQRRNLPPAEDGIHDPDNDGTLALQPPLVAFGELAHSNAGNRVDWVKSLNEGKINPRADRIDPKAVPAVMDLNIVREVKGSMPDVVYPHKQHTEWLDCSNCHPAIFKPQKGANQISMAGILLGQQCGVCHGKVAFPVSECRLCHSKPKTAASAAAAPAAAPATGAR